MKNKKSFKPSVGKITKRFPMTLEVLGNMMITGFSDVGGDLGIVKEQIHQLTDRVEIFEKNTKKSFNEIHTTLTALNNKIDTEIENLAAMSARSFTKVTEEIGTLRFEMHDRFTLLENTLFDHEERIKKIEE